MPLESAARCGEQDHCSLPASAEVHCHLVIAKDIDWHCLGKPLLRPPDLFCGSQAQDEQCQNVMGHTLQIFVRRWSPLGFLQINISSSHQVSGAKLRLQSVTEKLKVTERVEDVTGTSPQSPAFPLIVPGCFHFSF